MKFATKHMAAEEVPREDLAQGKIPRKRLATETSSISMRPSKRSSAKVPGIPTPVSSTGDSWALYEPSPALTSWSSVQADSNYGHTSNLATSHVSPVCSEGYMMADRLLGSTFFPVRSEAIPPLQPHQALSHQEPDPSQIFSFEAQEVNAADAIPEHTSTDELDAVLDSLIAEHRSDIDDPYDWSFKDCEKSREDWIGEYEMQKDVQFYNYLQH